MRHDLSSGDWIDIRPLQSLKQRDQDVYDGAIKIYVTFDKDGNPDMSKLPLSMSLQKVRRNALLARLLIGWSFKIEGTEEPLPLPRWISDDQGMEHDESVGELPIDDAHEIWAIVQPYIEKCDRKPDPKAMTTSGSNGTSRAREGASRKG